MGTPVITGSGSAKSTSASSLTLPTFAVDPQSGIVVFAAGLGVSFITDSNGNLYTLRRTVSDTGLILETWTADNATGNPALAITVHYLGTGEVLAAAAGFFEEDTPPAFDVVGAGDNGASQPATDALITTAGGDAVFLGTTVNNSATFVALLGAALLEQQALPAVSLALSFTAAGGAGTYAPEIQVSPGSVTWIANAVAMRTLPTAPPLVAFASGVPADGPAPLLVAFTGAAAGGTPPYSYAWDFGDGHTSAVRSPSHTYASPSTYTATLTVTDAVPNTAKAIVVTVVVSGGMKAIGGAVGAHVRPGNTQGVSSRSVRVS